MSTYYFDSSAIVKRYVNERGSTWVRLVCEAVEPETQLKVNILMLGEITLAEVAAAFAKRVYKTKELREDEGVDIYKHFLTHVTEEYEIVPLTSALIIEASNFAWKHALRAYDAVQLAMALHARHALQQSETELVFVCSDSALVQAARAEGLAVENPLTHTEADAK